MTSEEFKRTAGSILRKYGFTYEKKAYYARNDELIILIDLQKSQYSNNFYVNCGFLLKHFYPDMKYPKEYNCNVISGFKHHCGGKSEWVFEVDIIDTQCLIDSIEEETQEMIMPVLQKGLQEYFKRYPQSLPETSERVRKYLNI